MESLHCHSNYRTDTKGRLWLRISISIQFELSYRDGVSPAEAAASLPASPAAAALAKKKGAAASDVRERAAAVRTRRLMKELKEIQRLQDSRPDPVFTVHFASLLSSLSK